MISGETLKEHDERLLQVLQKLESAGITLNENKCVFAKRPHFLGHHIDEYGLQPCPEKVCAITTKCSDIRRFLGMVNQLAKFSQNIAVKNLYVICSKSKIHGHGDRCKNLLLVLLSKKSARTLYFAIIIPIGKSWSQLIVRHLDLAVCIGKIMVTFGSR